MEQWYLDEIEARAAWALMPTLAGGAIDWGNVVAAHIDTGVTRHPVFRFAGDKSPFLKVELGLNLLEDGEPPFDSFRNKKLPGHGTRTASVLCGDAADGSFKGVAPGVPTIPYRAVDHPVIEATTEQARVAAAIDDALAKGASVISMSIGFPAFFGANPIGPAIDRAYDRGVIVAAAGGQLSDAVTYPGKYSRTIGCGGCTRARRVYNPYDKGDTERSIDVWAPADEMVRADATFPSDGAWAEAPYTLPGQGAHGTSYSTAQVAGAAALFLAGRAGELSARYGAPGWKRIEAFRRLVGDAACCTALTDPFYWFNAPRGILNVRAVMQAPLPDLADADKVTRLAADERF